MTFGRHLLLDLYGCTNKKLLLSEPNLESTLALAATKAGATVRSYHNHGFLDRETGEEAWSITVILEESHIAAHIWPNTGFVSLDMYTCGHEADPMLALDYLLDMFQPDNYTLKFVHRGEGLGTVPVTKGTGHKQPIYVTDVTVRKAE